MEKNSIEIVRSYSQKLNLGNYTTCDFFCSIKAEVDDKEVAAKSKELNDFCLEEVSKSIKEYLGPKTVDTKLGEEFQKNYNQRSVLDQIKEEQK
jgi:hypothetical protein